MGTNITFLPRNCTIYITVMHAHRGEISLTKIRTPSFDGILAVVGANPNPDLQIRYSIQIFVKLYLDLREKLIEVFGFGFYLRIVNVFGFGFAGRGFVPISAFWNRWTLGLDLGPGKRWTLDRYCDPKTQKKYITLDSCV